MDWATWIWGRLGCSAWLLIGDSRRRLNFQAWRTVLLPQISAPSLICWFVIWVKVLNLLVLIGLNSISEARRSWGWWFQLNSGGVPDITTVAGLSYRVRRMAGSSRWQAAQDKSLRPLPLLPFFSIRPRKKGAAYGLITFSWVLPHHLSLSAGDVAQTVPPPPVLFARGCSAFLILLFPCFH